MTTTINPKEEQRKALQARIDGTKTQDERNRMGQFGTPTALARDIVRYAVSKLPIDEGIRFLEPGFGTGAFFSALLNSVPPPRLLSARAFELDHAYGTAASTLWASTDLELTVGDFTKATPPSTEQNRFNLIVCNPPYIRHHHIVNGDKTPLRNAVAAACGMKLSGLAGFYCYFLGLAHAWMSKGGIAAWLIPSEFMDVNYGRVVKDYLLRRVTLLRMHRFEPSDIQFTDALVSSAIVSFRNEPPPPDHEVEFTYGGLLDAPHERRLLPASKLTAEAKWTHIPHTDTHIDPPNSALTLSDFFTIKRGIATGDNRFFILSLEEIKRLELPIECFRPILPSQRYIAEDEIFANADGSPALDKNLFLLDCNLSEAEIDKHFPRLSWYLRQGKQTGVHEGYLCKHRNPWYSQEQRPVTPFICTYIGRGDAKSGRPFRFILNHSSATVANVYLLLYPRPPLAELLKEHPEMKKRVWEALRKLTTSSLIQHGRVYGGGLHKMEPRELGNVPAAAVAAIMSEYASKMPPQDSESLNTASGLFSRDWQLQLTMSEQ